MIKKIIAFIILIAALVALGYVAVKITHKGIGMVEEATVQNYNTQMLLVQAKVKLISEQAVLDDDKSGYKGVKLAESDVEDAKALIEQEIIDKEEESFDYYYVWDQAVLDELQVNTKLAEGEYYVVNYETREVITTKGIKVPNVNKIYYKLSELKELIKE